MNKPIHPAVAEHVMEENERLRGLLTTLRISLNLGDTEYGLSQQEKRKLAADIDAALSQQAEPVCQTMQRPKAECGCPDCGSSLIDWPTAEPTDTYTAADMATAAAQGFRDGQAAVEPAPAQDEREAYQVGDPVVLHDGRWGTIKQLIPNKAKGFVIELRPGFGGTYGDWEFTRPAQTEQQPVGHQFQDREGVWKQFMSERHYEDTLADGTWPIRAIYAAPIAQTAPQPEQSVTVRVPASVIEEAAHMLEAHSPGSGSVESFTAQDLRAALASQGPKP